MSKRMSESANQRISETTRQVWRVREGTNPTDPQGRDTQVQGKCERRTNERIEERRNIFHIICPAGSHFTYYVSHIVSHFLSFLGVNYAYPI